MTIGDTIKQLRHASGLTQQALADRVEISRSYLSLIEQDRREATLPLLRRLADALGSPAAVLFAVALGAAVDDSVQSDVAEAIKKLVESVRLNITQHQLVFPNGDILPG
jgi:transcriptional regulator with XRE-family HTH domain